MYIRATINAANKPNNYVGRIRLRLRLTVFSSWRVGAQWWSSVPSIRKVAGSLSQTYDTQLVRWIILKFTFHQNQTRTG